MAGVIPASAPVTEACMLNTSAVAPFPRASSYATSVYSAKLAPSPPSRSGTISPNIPAVRRSAKSSTGKVPSRSYPAARPASRGASRAAATEASAILDPPALVDNRCTERRYHRHRTPPGDQPPCHRRQLGPKPAYRQPYPVPRALTHQRAGIDEQVGIVDPGHARREPLGHGHRDETRQPGRIERVEHEQPARSQDPAGLCDRRRYVDHVLQQLARADHVGAPVGQRQRGHVRPYRRHAVLLRPCQGGSDEVDADVVIALVGDPRGQEPAAKI